MSEREYVIKEVNGQFVIMIYVIRTKGIFWWRKNVRELERSDIYGNPVGYGYISTTPHPSFDTLEEAQEQVRKFKAPVVYHETE